MPTLKVKNNGVWERVMGGSGNVSTESGSLIVNLDTKTMTASHSASEIYNAIQSGKIVSAISDLNIMYNLWVCSEENAGFIITVVESGNIDNYAEATFVFLLNDKTFSFATQKINGLPAGGTVGQVLTIGSDGNPIWGVSSGGGSGTIVNNDNILVVVIDEPTSTFSHTVTDVNEAINSGKAVIGVVKENGAGVVATLLDSTQNYCVFGYTIVYQGAAITITYTLNIDGTMSADINSTEKLPDGGTVGQVLTIGSDGNPIWSTVSGGGSIGEGTQVQVDYNQNDSSAVDYIKNRPFYAETTTVFDQDVTAELQEGLIAGYNHPECVIDMSSAKDGDSFAVTVDGHSYSCAMIDGMIGNLYIILEFMAKMYNVTVEQLLAAEPGFAEMYPDTGEPFIIMFNYNVADDGTVNESTTFIFREIGTYHCTIDTGIIHKIDSKFLNTDELLPTVNVNNNGQVLGVVNGKWAATKAASGLPEVTTADNDKILMVVDGQWIAGSIANGDEVYY